MATEIERKFLVTNDTWKPFTIKELSILQFYINENPLIRVRFAQDLEKVKGSISAYLTIKGRKKGFSCPEFEFEIDHDEAVALVEHFSPCKSLSKLRYHVPYDKHIWEVDVFKGSNEGLIVAELELESEAEKFLLPPWIGEEVSGDKKYSNINLATLN